MGGTLNPGGAGNFTSRDGMVTEMSFGTGKEGMGTEMGGTLNPGGVGNFASNSGIVIPMSFGMGNPGMGNGIGGTDRLGKLQPIKSQPSR